MNQNQSNKRGDKSSEKGGRQYIISHDPFDASRLREYLKNHSDVRILSYGGRYATTFLTTPQTARKISDKVIECWGEIRELREGDEFQPPSLY